MASAQRLAACSTNRASGTRTQSSGSLHIWKATMFAGPTLEANTGRNACARCSSGQITWIVCVTMAIV